MSLFVWLPSRENYSTDFDDNLHKDCLSTLGVTQAYNRFDILLSFKMATSLQAKSVLLVVNKNEDPMGRRR